MSFAAYLMQVENLLIVAAVWTVIKLAQRFLPDVFKQRLVVRFLPLLPIGLTSLAVWLPGVGPVDLTAGNRVLLGIVLGAMVAHAHKVFAQTALGYDRRL